uniref:Uncharacterized protein n=1 Tax=Sphaerodactylus townsendi TaxID=933632 RepID=A0ACB8FIQ3_9SAUR
MPNSILPAPLGPRISQPHSAGQPDNVNHLESGYCLTGNLTVSHIYHCPIKAFTAMDDDASGGDNNSNAGSDEQAQVTAAPATTTLGTVKVQIQTTATPGQRFSWEPPSHTSSHCVSWMGAVPKLRWDDMRDKLLEIERRDPIYMSWEKEWADF